jgi:hypothetical protein
MIAGLKACAAAQKCREFAWHSASAASEIGPGEFWRCGFSGDSIEWSFILFISEPHNTIRHQQVLDHMEVLTKATVLASIVSASAEGPRKARGKGEHSCIYRTIT